MITHWLWVVKCARASSSVWVDDGAERDVCWTESEERAGELVRALDVGIDVLRNATLEQRVEIERSGTIGGIPFLDPPLVDFDGRDTAICYYAAPVPDAPGAVGADRPKVVGRLPEIRRHIPTARERQAVLEDAVQAAWRMTGPAMRDFVAFRERVENVLRLRDAWSADDRLAFGQWRNGRARLEWSNTRARDAVTVEVYERNDREASLPPLPPPAQLEARMAQAIRRFTNPNAAARECDGLCWRGGDGPPCDACVRRHEESRRG